MQKLTKEQGIVLTAYTGTLMCHIADFQEEIEKRLGRDVLTHEFCRTELWDELKTVYHEDFMELLPR